MLWTLKFHSDQACGFPSQRASWTIDTRLGLVGESLERTQACYEHLLDGGNLS